jgi:hypothetical protein
MKIVVYSIVIITYLFFFSCKICNEDQALKKEFFNCIRVVEKIQKEGYFLDTDYAESANCRAFSIECLAAITGYQGYVDKGNEPHYFYPYSDTIDYVDVDIKKWQEWYEDNKCTITMQTADSLIKKYSIDYGVPGLHWPISADSLVNDDKCIYLNINENCSLFNCNNYIFIPFFM